tara:strand:- start:3153 stop:5240 length:2088 start_codon:yes stop_codon:yes gene_type:complete
MKIQQLSENELKSIAHSLGRKPRPAELEILNLQWSESVSHKSTSIFLRSYEQINAAIMETLNPSEVGIYSDELKQGVGTSLRSCRLTGKSGDATLIKTTCADSMRDLVASSCIPHTLAASVQFSDKKATQKQLKKISTVIINYGKSQNVNTILRSVAYDQQSQYPLITIYAIGLKTGVISHEPLEHLAGNPVYLLECDAGRSKNVLTRLKNEESLRKTVLYLNKTNYTIICRNVADGGMAMSWVGLIKKLNCGISLQLNTIQEGQKGVESKLLFDTVPGRVITVLLHRFEKELKKLCSEHNIVFYKIGKLTDTNELVIKSGNKLLSRLPLALLQKNITVPLHKMEATRPHISQKTPSIKLPPKTKLKQLNENLLSLLKSPEISVNTNFLLNSNSDLDIFKCNSGEHSKTEQSQPLSAALCCNAATVHLDSEMAGKGLMLKGIRQLLVARNVNPVTCSVSYTLPNPADSDTLHFFNECTSGIRDTLIHLKIPLVSVKVFYEDNSNENLNVMVGLTGIAKDGQILLRASFKRTNNFILIVGSLRGELAASSYMKTIHGQIMGPLPSVDLNLNKRLNRLIRKGGNEKLILTAYDVGAGGIAVAVAQSLMVSPEGTGARIFLSSKLKREELLFGETQGLFLITIEETALMDLERLCLQEGLSCTAIGRVTDTGQLSINDMIALDVKELKKVGLKQFPIC